MNKYLFRICGFLLSISLIGCAFAPTPISDAVPSNGTTCFVGEFSGPFTEFTSCNPEIIRKETRSNNGADLISFQAPPGQGTSATSELSIMRIVTPSQLAKGDKDSLRKYTAFFYEGPDKYSDTLAVEDTTCTFLFRIGRDKNIRVWRLTRFYARIGPDWAMTSPLTYCAGEKKKWEEPRAFKRISTEKVEK